MGRILALDIGEKRVGLAMTDEAQIIVTPLNYTIRPKVVINEIKNQHPAFEKIVVGLPLTLANEENQQTRKIKDLGQRIERETGIEVVYFDERLTSKAAKAFYDQKNTVPLDCIAAQLILEQYLNKNR